LDRRAFPGFTLACVFPGRVLMSENVARQYAALMNCHTHADFPGIFLLMI
jgi:hypothetical protein